MVETKRRQTPRWLAILTVMGLATLFTASAARAETSVSVVSSGVNPNPVTLGQTFSVTFSATLNGAPGANAAKECVAGNVKWSWNVTVSGPAGSQTYSNPNGSNSYTLSHKPSASGLNACGVGTYTIVATATASYEASAECGGNSSASGNTETGVAVNDDTCPE